MCRPGESETSFTGKLIASLTTCQSTSSGTSGVANGRTTRKQTSVNGSPRNSSSSSGECRRISAGMYRPPSGASPRSTAPRSEVSGAFRAVLRYLIRKCSPLVPARLQKRSHARPASLPVEAQPAAAGAPTPASISLLAPSFALNHFQKRRGIQRSIAQLGDFERAMRERFIALTPRGNQRRITPRHRFAWFFARLWLKRAAPQHRLWIVQISFDQQLLLFSRRREIHDAHLAPQAHQQIVPGVNDAAGGIEHQGFLRLLLEFRQDFIQRVNLLCQVFLLAFDVGRGVRPAHPRGHAARALVVGGNQTRRELLLDTVVARNRGIAVSR